MKKKTQLTNKYKQWQELLGTDTNFRTVMNTGALIVGFSLMGVGIAAVVTETASPAAPYQLLSGILMVLQVTSEATQKIHERMHDKLFNEMKDVIENLMFDNRQHVETIKKLALKLGIIVIEPDETKTAKKERTIN